MILDGKKTAEKIKAKLIKRVPDFTKQNIMPKLVIYWAGDDPVSRVYIAQKQKMAAAIGAECEVRKYEVGIEQDKILGDIHLDNKNDAIHGVIVQLPLPTHLSKNQLIQAIDPTKDVDGLQAVNQWKLITGQPGLVPATAKGIMTLLADYGIDLASQKVVVVGRSNLVGLPTALSALNRNATVTICHSQTKDLPTECRQADILITAIGQPGLITAEYVKAGAVVVDVGITRTTDGISGDVDYDTVKDKAAAITPVPGGVGPMTVVSLWENLLEAIEK